MGSEEEWVMTEEKRWMCSTAETWLHNLPLPEYMSLCSISLWLLPSGGGVCFFTPSSGLRYVTCYDQ